MSRKAVLLLAIAVLAVLALGVTAWIGITGLQAKDELQSASGALSRAKTAITQGDVAGARVAAAEAAQRTAAARADTSDAVWQLVGAVPFLGATARTVTLTAQAADEVASGALPPLVSAAESLEVEQLRKASGLLDLLKVKEAAADAAIAQEGLDQASRTLAATPQSGVLGPVADARDELAGQLAAVSRSARIGGQVLSVLPQLLGSAAPQTYFIAFQSPAEIRGTGGFLGTYGIMTVAQGKLTVDHVGPNTELKDFSAPVLDLGSDYRQLYGNAPALWVNMNLSPNFPFAGAQWATAWQKQSGQRVDGVLGIDVKALEYLVEATGPVTTPDGKTLTADQVVPYLANGIYAEYADTPGSLNLNAERKEYQATIATELLTRLLSFSGDSQALITALTKSVAGRHLQVWSSAPGIQRTLAETPLAGATSTAPGPYLQLVLNNGAGNKMDYYLKREVRYAGGACQRDARNSSIDITLTNTIPKDGSQPRFIEDRGDVKAPGAAPRSNRTLVYVHTTAGSGMLKATLDGKPVGVGSGTELGHPVISLQLDLPAGVPVQLHLELTEPNLPGEPLVPEQPMVQPQQTDVNWPACAAR